MKRVWLILIMAGATLIYILFSNLERKRPQVVFCNVGQGDAIYLRLPEQMDVLIDTGPYGQVVNCLDQSMPYFDRQIELLFLTHLDKDHAGGLETLSKSYEILHLYLPKSALGQKLHIRANSVEYLEKGEQVTVGHSVFKVLSPAKEQLKMPDINPNDAALGLLALVNSKQILLLSDLNVYWAEKALQGLNLRTDIFKLLHHGSKYGLSQKVLRLTKPALAVVSVGKRNFYGHPHPEVLKLLKNLRIPLKRTDKEGHIEIML